MRLYAIRLFCYNFDMPHPNPKNRHHEKFHANKEEYPELPVTGFFNHGQHEHTVQARNPPEKDVINTTGGPAEITFIGHGSLMIVYQGKVVHVDPFSKLTDYSVLTQGRYYPYHP